MSAETLRRAAEVIRDEDPGCPAMHGCPWHGPVALAVADWLDEAADEFGAQVGSIWISCAQSVARAYLGEAS